MRLKAGFAEQHLLQQHKHVGILRVMRLKAGLAEQH